MPDDSNEVSVVYVKPNESKTRRRRAKKLYARREPSLPLIVVPSREIIWYTADKTTCAECTCFPKEDPYCKHKKLNPCLNTPLTLYEYAAAVVDRLPLPEAFNWTVEQTADWMENKVGMPEYRQCIIDNNIDGRRLIMFEDPSNIAKTRVKQLKHAKIISAKIHKLFGTEWVKFARSIGLPPRKPLTHCTWFKSRTGPAWGIRQNWTRTDILRWMKILMPAPKHLDHWDLVWHMTPDFPKVKFARIPPPRTHVHVPHYEPLEEKCFEYLAPRKFRIDQTIPDSQQMIWMEHREFSATQLEGSAKLSATKRRNWTIPLKTSLEPKKVSLEGKTGTQLLLARRLLPRKKFHI